MLNFRKHFINEMAKPPKSNLEKYGVEVGDHVIYWRGMNHGDSLPVVEEIIPSTGRGKKAQIRLSKAGITPLNDWVRVVLRPLKTAHPFKIGDWVYRKHSGQITHKGAVVGYTTIYSNDPPDIIVKLDGEKYFWTLQTKECFLGDTPEGFGDLL